MKQSKIAKPYWEMTASELAEATKVYDRPIPASKLRPLTKSEREQFERSRRRGVRSVFLNRKKPVTVTLELDKDLIDQSQKYAKRQQITLAQVIERSLRSSLTFVQAAPSSNGA